MFKHFLIMMLSCVLLGGLSPLGAGEDHDCHIAHVELFAQQTPKWCWAAVAEMIMHSHSVNVEQCRMAKIAKPGKKCCENFNLCVRGWDPPYQHYGFNIVPYYEPLPWPDILHQLKKIGAFDVHWRINNSQTHYMVVRGYLEANRFKLLVINDPWPWNSLKSVGGSYRLIPYDRYLRFSDYPVRWSGHHYIRPAAAPVQTKINIPRGDGSPLEIKSIRGFATSLGAAKKAHQFLAEEMPLPALKVLGFNSLKMARKSRLDKIRPLKIADIDTGSVTEDKNRAVYPILVDEREICAVILAKVARRKWELASYTRERGGRDTGIEKIITKEENYFIVEIPELNLNFTGFKKNKTLFLVTPYPYPQLNLEPNIPKPAKQVFQAIKKYREEIKEQ